MRWREAVRDPNAVLLDGFHALKHAVRFKADVLAAITCDKQAARELAAELAGDLTDTIDTRLTEVSEQQFRELVPKIHQTGVAALARRSSPDANWQTLTSERSAPVVLLENPRNLGNVGAVIRVAAGIGATGVITTGNLDPWHPNVVRGSAGLHFATAVEPCTLAELPAGPLLALDPEGDDIRSVRIPDNAVLAFGSERHGISPELRSRSDQLLSIPMRPHVSSFNLATSVAMTLFHWLSTGQPA